MLPGWVYVLVNPTLPGILKIGQTTHTPARRAVQVEREYGVAAPFEVASKHATPNPAAIEQAAHRMLADCRLPRSELFRCSPGEAARVVKAAVRAYEKPWAVTVWLRRLLHPPRPERLSNGWRRSRRGSAEELLALARTCQTSPSRLGQIAVRQMLVQARAGALPMVAPSLVKAATPHPELGYDPRTGFTFPIVQS